MLQWKDQRGKRSRRPALRAQAQQIAESEKADLRKEAQRSHEKVVEKSRVEAQEFEASKNREIEELRSQILLLNRQLAGL
ncbi:MAG: hypothetical protein LQ346_002983 [Caloplaca aetnensis]|nr:MAG: hypothetical protein LQ346_002983 [Caloplaca aetnensis]